MRKTIEVFSDKPHLGIRVHPDKFTIHSNKSKIRAKHIVLIIIFLMVLAGAAAYALDSTPSSINDFFSSAGHAPSGKVSYWYSRYRGGLESVTNIPFGNLPCRDCHMACNACHKTRSMGEFFYSTEAAGGERVCFDCHRWQWILFNNEQIEGVENVHSNSGVSCVDCHEAMIVYENVPVKRALMDRGSSSRPGCGKCHQETVNAESHRRYLHDGKLACEACHVRQIVSCTNCHIDTIIKEGRKEFVPLDGWIFLMNYNGKVTSATIDTFIAPGGETFIMFAPRFSHSVMREGRKCEQCHGSGLIEEIIKGRVTLTWLENGNIENRRGVIPIVEGTSYEMVYQKYENGRWVPLPDSPEPVIQYAGYGTPLNGKQLQNLIKPQDKAYTVIY